MAASILAQADRIHLGAGLRFAISHGLMSNCFCCIACNESDILRFFKEPPPDYELLLQYAVADVVIQLSQQFQQEGKNVVIHASIKLRREVIISISPNDRVM